MKVARYLNFYEAYMICMKTHISNTDIYYKL